MVSVELALQLKQAGLTWEPAEGDSFTVPGTDLNSQVFVLSQLAAHIQVMKGHPFVMFHGSSEWAMDYVLTTDVVWLPSETQVRAELERRLDPFGQPTIRLQRLPDYYHCSVSLDGTDMLFMAPTASDAYGQALLYLIKERG